MKRVRFTAALVAVALMLTVAGCSTKEEPAEEMTVPLETRTYSSATLDKEYSFEVCMENSDMIADVTFIENLGTGDTEGLTTFFAAKVNRTFKGEEFDEIIILQSGSIEDPIIDYPIFNSGDRLLLFLFEEDYNREKYMGKYWVTGAYTALLDVCEYEGEPYLLSRLDMVAFAQDLSKNEKIGKISGELKTSIIAQAKINNPEVAEIESNHGYVFSYNDYVDVIRSWQQEGLDNEKEDS